MSAIQLSSSNKIANAVYLAFSIPLITYIFWIYYHSLFDDLRAAVAVILLVSSFSAGGLFYVRIERVIPWMCKRIIFETSKTGLIKFTFKKRLLNEEWMFAIAERWETPSIEIKSNLDTTLSGPDLSNELWSIYGAFYFLGGTSCALPILIDSFPIADKLLIHNNVYNLFYALAFIVIIAIGFNNRKLTGDTWRLALFRGLQETRAMVETRVRTKNESLFPPEAIMSEIDEMVRRRDWSRFRRRFDHLMHSIDKKYEEQAPKSIENLSMTYLDVLVKAANDDNPKKHMKDIQLIAGIIDSFYPEHIADSTNLAKWKSVLEVKVDWEKSSGVLIETVLEIATDSDTAGAFSPQLKEIINNRFPKLRNLIKIETFIKVIRNLSINKELWDDCKGALFDILINLTNPDEIQKVFVTTLEWGSENWIKTPIHIAEQLVTLSRSKFRQHPKKRKKTNFKGIFESILKRRDEKFIISFLKLVGYQELSIITILDLAYQRNKSIDNALLNVFKKYLKTAKNTDQIVEDLKPFSPIFSRNEKMKTTSEKGYFEVLLVIDLVFNTNLVSEKRNLLELVEGIVLDPGPSSKRIFQKSRQILRIHGDKTSKKVLKQKTPDLIIE